jgi:hypothetical protein
MKASFESFIVTVALVLLSPVVGLGQTLAPAIASPSASLAGSGHPDLSSAIKAEVLLAEVKKNDLPSIRATLMVMPENWEQSRVLTVVYNDTKNLAADFYYPSDMDFATPRPVVVFLNGFRDRQAPGNLKSVKDLGQYISWGAALAARGLIAVSYAVSTPQEDLDGLLSFLQTNSAKLGLDFSRLGIFTCSASGMVVFQNLMNPAKPYYHAIRAMLVLYAKTQPWGGFVPPAIPYMLVKADRDDPKINTQMDALALAIKDAGGDLVLETHETGIHAFDLYLDDPRTQELILASQDFLVRHLTAPGSR